MKGRSIFYTDKEMLWLKANRLLVIGEYHRQFCATFGRSDVSAVNLNALRKRKGWRTGRTGCFPKGNAPVNKGQKCAEGTGGRHPNACATQFKKGKLSGRAQQLYKPVGTERVTIDGYIERKIHDDLPMHTRWQAVHRIEWEKINGPIPAGFALKCLDGDTFNTAPDNWDALPRAVLARLNGGRHRKTVAYDAAAPELKPAIMASAKLKHAAFELRKQVKVKS